MPLSYNVTLTDVNSSTSYTVKVCEKHHKVQPCNLSKRKGLKNISINNLTCKMWVDYFPQQLCLKEIMQIRLRLIPKMKYYKNVRQYERKKAEVQTTLMCVCEFR